jgi:hypothetical protein
MSSAGSIGDAAIKLFSVEMFSKDSPLYEENVFKVYAKFRANSSSLSFLFSVQRLWMKF